MGFDTVYRFSVHAAVFNDQGEVLLLRQSYTDRRWGLPGGGVEPGETVYDAIDRECREELGIGIIVEAFTGIYFHREFNAQAAIFRCRIPEGAAIRLSPEHTEYRWASINELGAVQRIRVGNAFQYGGFIGTGVF